MRGRPRTAIGTYGAVRTWRRGKRYSAEVRYRDVDGRVRKVMATHSSRSRATSLLKERLKNVNDGRNLALVTDPWVIGGPGGSGGGRRG